MKDPGTAALMTVAFGGDPGRWPLPGARTPRQRWLRAVAAGGQGRYGCARTDLEALRRDASGPLLSLAYSTQASFLRQLGGHVPARGLDGRAFAAAGTDTTAAVDALTGLAADALGVARFAAAHALLNRAEALLGAVPLPERARVRLAWVAAELAMARGDGEDAVRHARRAHELAGAYPSVRHRVKTDLVLAAALCSAGRVGAAQPLADEVFVATERAGLVPLRWAAAALLAGIGSKSFAPRDVIGIRDACRAEVQRRGGVWYR